MDSHVYFAGPNGLCEVCGLPRESCSREQQLWVAGSGQREKTVNPALVFYSQLPDTVKVYQISCTQHNSFVLSCTGEVFSWGETTNALGRLMSKRDEAGVPMKVDRLTVPIVAIACGDHHVLALDTSANLWSWGLNKYGQLGLGHKDDRSLPEPIPSIQSIARVAAGPNCSFAVSTHGNVYVWGDNKNSQLGQAVDRSGKKKGEFVEPQEIYYMPWDKGGDVLVTHDKQAKTYFYKGQQTISQGDSSVSASDLRKLELENTTLKAQLQRLTVRITFLEEELYGHYSEKNPLWKGDSLLDDMERIKKTSVNGVKEVQRKIEGSNRQIEMLEADIRHLAENVKSLEEKEASYWDDLEHMENELMKMQRDTHVAVDVVRKQRQLKDDLLAQTNALSQIKAEMNSLLAARQQDKIVLEEGKSGLQKQLEDQKRMAQIYDQMIYVRKKDLSALMIEKSTETIAQDLINFAVMHEALQETSVSTISQTKDCSGLSAVVQISTELLNRIKSDLKKHIKEGEDPLQQHMNRVWEVLQDNADLRLKLNDYLLGIMEHTHQKLEEFYTINSHFPRKELTTARSAGLLHMFEGETSTVVAKGRQRVRRKRRSWC